MDIRQAILRAASFIEAHPERFDFNVCGTPHDCGAPGCAIGWLSYFSGKKWGLAGSEFHRDFGLRRDRDFYGRMGALCVHPYSWKDNATLCADTLRLYADKYHPESEQPKREGIPDSVRAIFNKVAA